MSGLMIPCVGTMSHTHPSKIGKRLTDSGKVISVDKINWENFPHLPDVKVYLAYDARYLWMHFTVSDDFIRADCRRDQEPVWQDSCVEFFLKQGDIYRNFEFNCLGVCLSAIGPDRFERTGLDPGNMAEILRIPSLKDENLPSGDKPAEWTLTIAIPLCLIGLDAGSRFMANFYKCGDKTIVPHYISWSPIGTPAPDFHQPGFFAHVELVK
jgi:hypothetical protein